MTALALKFTRAGRVPSYQGGEPLPHRRWLPEVADPVLCERGWHACRWEDTPFHVAAELWVVKIDGQIVYDDDKIACSRMMLVEQITTWDERLQRLWAADCAERVLPIYEAEYHGDDRPRLAIAAARDFAEGRITAAARDAAGDAAWVAAWAAAGAAARAAARAAWAAADAAGAAWVAAWAAARAAAWDAAGDAAWDAAGDAADAAWGAVSTAAKADDAAAERRWQADRLGELCGLDPDRFIHRETL